MIFPIRVSGSLVCDMSVSVGTSCLPIPICFFFLPIMQSTSSAIALFLHPLLPYSCSTLSSFFLFLTHINTSSCSLSHSLTHSLSLSLRHTHTHTLIIITFIVTQLQYSHPAVRQNISEALTSHKKKMHLFNLNPSSYVEHVISTLY